MILQNRTLQKLMFRASVARNFCGIYFRKKGTVNKNILAKGVASVARNLIWALPRLKGTVK